MQGTTGLPTRGVHDCSVWKLRQIAHMLSPAIQALPAAPHLENLRLCCIPLEDTVILKALATKEHLIVDWEGEWNLGVVLRMRPQSIAHSQKEMMWLGRMLPHLAVPCESIADVPYDSIGMGLSATS